MYTGWMRYFLLALLVIGLFPSSARAELISPRPYCATIKNTAEFMLYVMIRSDYGTNRSGKKQRHESSFRLEPGKDTQVCSTGPFYPGYKVELVIKSLLPVFNCKTRLVGTIPLKVDERPDGTHKIYAVCAP